MTKALQVEVSDEQVYVEEDRMQLCSSDVEAKTNLQEGSSTTVTTQRVRCDISPFFFAFYKHHTCKIVIDTGATSSLISHSFAKKIGLTISPTLHSARQLNRSSLAVTGEVKFSIHYGSSELLVDGLVNDSLDCDILAGVPFCKTNDINVFMKK